MAITLEVHVLVLWINTIVLPGSSDEADGVTFYYLDTILVFLVPAAQITLA